MTKADIHQAIEFINDKIFMVLPERDGEQRLTIHNVLEEFEKLRGQHGCKGYVIDPFNEMSHCRPPGQSQTEYVGEWISLVRRFCRVNNVHTWVVAHPRKFDVKNDNVGHGQDTPVVRPSDIEDSRFWWSKGDNILSIWRSQLNPTDEVTVHIQKIKPRYVGRQGSAILRYDKVSGSYSDPLNP
jgi:twinkle protein